MGRLQKRARLWSTSTQHLQPPAYDIKDIQTRFGPIAAQMVEGLTKLNKIEFADFVEMALIQNIK